MLALQAFLRDKGWFDGKHRAAESGGAAGFSGVGYGSRRCAAGRQQPYSDWQGLSRIRAGKYRPGIKALLEISNRDPQQLPPVI